LTRGNSASGYEALPCKNTPKPTPHPHLGNIRETGCWRKRFKLNNLQIFALDVWCEKTSKIAAFRPKNATFCPQIGGFEHENQP
jgi:hypothetical protein